MDPEEGKFKQIEGGVAAPESFRAAGVSCGIKKEGERDIALIYSEKVATAAGAFTTNRIQAAPVKLSRNHLKGGRCQALIVNSGLANACTGAGGERDAWKMAEATASGLGISPELVAVCSTGRIGEPLPWNKVERGISELVRVLKGGGNQHAASAIMTTDTFPKEMAVEFKLGGRPVKVGGMAKGAGMIYPRLKVLGLNRATMLAFITTDVTMEAMILKDLFSHSLEQSFNRITVDGDTSTNDTVIMMANGAAGVKLQEESAFRGIFQQALNFVTRKLARMIVADGEGATKVVEIEVRGARTEEEARRVAAAVANSNLFKATLYGETPNWGRMMAAMGYSGAGIREDKINVHFGEIAIINAGVISESDSSRIRERLQQEELHFVIDLGLGKAHESYLTCDLTPQYVEINKR